MPDKKRQRPALATLILAGIALPAFACDRGPLVQLIKSAKTDNQTSGDPTTPAGPDASVPNPACAPSKVPPPPPGVSPVACPPLGTACDGTALWCYLKNTLAVLTCDPKGGWQASAVDGEIVCQSPTPPSMDTPPDPGKPLPPPPPDPDKPLPPASPDPAGCKWPPPPANYDVEPCPTPGTPCPQPLPVWCTSNNATVMMFCGDKGLEFRPLETTVSCGP